MAEDRPTPLDKMSMLRSATPARIFLPRAGAALTTRATLDFQLAHAEARDAVEERLDVDALSDELTSRGLTAVRVRSAARDRRSFLLRPDLGRRLDEESRERLKHLAGDYDIAFVIAEGLSARAIARHAIPVLERALQSLCQTSWKVAPIVLAEQGRVALGDDIGETLGARLAVVLIGERPGLSSPDSMGAYLTYSPRVGRTDAERNCLSNIRPQGLSYDDAARKLLYLCNESRRRQLTGVDLKDDADTLPSGEPRAIDAKS
ncbi:ethanolamine ammonia-lyase subunit EutC [Methylocystis sp. SC2]|uniref:ethanolamine ammonia-lyase subunit EutC n=1 Tax=Methylocystis sp. (strain SC2) TaxID=187303 RepID=UPI00027AEE87|nr:ethanolamine ammonia-lyase subunit EutC [Methylocystis sp. SC2]CCJ08186.1 Ethanolamine ammonia-lyase light chain [Methylocystis sp. SC2]